MMSSGGVAQERGREIPEQLSYLEGCISELMSLVDELEKRLAPISAIAVSPNTPTTSELKQQVTQIGGTIQEQSIRINSIFKHIKTLMNGLQI
jgi:hypothetical protein